MHDAAVDAERVVEALVSLDELLDRDSAPRSTRLRAIAASSSSAVFDPYGAGRAGAGARLDDEREADSVGEARGRRRRCRAAADRGARDAGRAQRLLHRRLVAAQVRGAHRGARDRGAPRARAAAAMTCASTVASSRSTHIRALDPAHGLDQRALVDDRRHVLVVRPASRARRRRASPSAARRSRSPSRRPRAARARTASGCPGSSARGRSRSQVALVVAHRRRRLSGGDSTIGRRRRNLSVRGATILVSSATEMV